MSKKFNMMAEALEMIKAKSIPKEEKVIEVKDMVEEVVEEIVSEEKPKKKKKKDESEE